MDIVKFDLTGIKKYSYSRLGTFHTCPYLYDRTYNGEKEDRGEQNAFAAAGSIGHEIIEDYYNGKFEEFELPNVFEEKWQSDFIDKGYEVELILPNYKKNLTDNYYKSFSNYFSNFKAYDNCKIIAVELEFNLVLSKDDITIIFTGIIDGLGIDENGEYIVWDSKSKGKWSSRAELDEYLRQLYIYAIYIKHKFGKFPKFLKFNQFRLTEKDRVTEEVFNVDDFNKAVNWLFKTVKEIECESLWLPNTSEPFFCSNLCNFRNNCDYKE